jgi:hypothetical protein
MCLVREGRVPGWGEALVLLRTDPDFVDALVEALAGVPLEAFLWETPPVSAATLARPFEWVVIENRFLATVATDDLPFAQHVRGEQGVRTFENLSGDATLVVPCAAGADPRPPSHAHLAAFVRAAPRALVHALWAEVARATEARLAASPEPCWVSTSGLGVFWVHVRIDERPKYYAHAPFRRPGS